ncbi:hypothetical protein BH23CHL8_BH23CHL8_18880 [soil metagenome]
MITVEVDFNDRDEWGNIPFDPADAMTALPGDAVDLFDEERNRCIGRIVDHGGTLSAAPNWLTFVSADSPRVVVQPGLSRGIIAALQGPLTVSISLARSFRLMPTTAVETIRPTPPISGPTTTNEQLARSQ